MEQFLTGDAEYSMASYRYFFYILATICLVLQAAAGGESSADVLVLNEANFDEALDLHGTLLVKFYAPW